MMTSEECSRKADVCDANALASIGTPIGDDWTGMATQWRRLAEDGTAQRTLARLMHERRA
ncbi:hypothetical protein BH09PSE1_BH09PSE1_14360 [soil metagenome]